MTARTYKTIAQPRKRLDVHLQDFRGDMDQFVAVAIAHFLALLIPGVDFFLSAAQGLTPHGNLGARTLVWVLRQDC
ncbi:hypothetical protein V5R04_14775 [Jonesiaceae bacterium BS-20]|uniref:Uncharacterized protein n=1 Tax=Jonesiaceae bacterium BS-20 TaxID=3120821 RepID=A0AAU7DWM3_9MICO